LRRVILIRQPTLGERLDLQRLIELHRPIARRQREVSGVGEDLSGLL
jgi:hypothetical protein